MVYRIAVSNFKRSAGFTLIELLVVISIIAMLLAILMPALGMVKEKARALVCTTNNRTLNQAYHLYLVESDNKFIPYYDSNSAAGVSGNLWMNSISSMIEDVKANRYCPVANESRIGEISLNTATFPGAGDYKVPWTWNGVDGKMYGSYTMNGWLYGPDDPYGKQHPALDFTSPSSVKRASSVPVFCDGIWSDGWPRDIDNIYNQVKSDPEKLKSGVFVHGLNNNMGRVCVDRHGMRISVSFFDGHAKLVKLEELWTLQWHRGFDSQNDISFK